MRARLQCPACSGTNLKFQCYAVVSPWVRQLSGINYGLSKYLSCKSCNSAFFNVEYSETTMSALYSDYRGEDYFRTRNSWEPSYSKELNQDLTGSETWLKNRQTQILDALYLSKIDVKTIESVIDFGGGHGGVMPPFKKRFLIEKNKNLKTASDITVLASVDEAREISFDLLMCCGVLEHVNNPADLLQEISHIGCKWYLFEVPKGLPKKRKGPGSFRVVLVLAASLKPLWRLLQKLERRISHSRRHLFPLRCSEHLQFFTELGLSRLLTRSGYDVVATIDSKPNEDLTHAQNLGFQEGIIIIARKAVPRVEKS